MGPTPGSPGPVDTDAGTPAATRQCGRCRQFVSVDPAVTLPGWWACPPCHLALFGTP